MATAKTEQDNPKTVDANGRPLYAPAPDLQPRLDEKNAALAERLKLIDKQTEDQRKAYPPAPGVKVVDK